jgi:hypothetical protein
MSPANTHTTTKFHALTAQAQTVPATETRTRREGNAIRMVSNVNHFCGFVKYQTLNLE